MTDILEKKLIEINPETKKVRSWKFNQFISWVLPTTIKNNYLIGLTSGIFSFSTSPTEKLSAIETKFPTKNTCRLNDACTDSEGRIWYGSMNHENPNLKHGQIASYSLSEGLIIHDSGYSVVNGPIVSPDEKFLYANDTLEGIIYRYDLDKEKCKLSNKIKFMVFSPSNGLPDGMCFDNDGNLWVAMWNGGQIIKIQQSGKILATFKVPALNITNVCFFGKDLERLLVSSASIEMTEEDKGKYPLPGKIFEIKNHNATGFNTYPAR